MCPVGFRWWDYQWVEKRRFWSHWRVAAEVRGRQEEAKTGGGSEDGSYCTTLTKRFTSKYQWSKLLKREMEEINQKKIIPI